MTSTDDEEEEEEVEDEVELELLLLDDVSESSLLDEEVDDELVVVVSDHGVGAMTSGGSIFSTKGGELCFFLCAATGWVDTFSGFSTWRREGVASRDDLFGCFDNS